MSHSPLHPAEILPGMGSQKLLIMYQRAKDRPKISCTSCHFEKDTLRKRERVCGGAGGWFGIPVLLKLLIRELKKF